jgi:formate dehydrogenase beta subunit
MKPLTRRELFGACAGAGAVVAATSVAEAAPAKPKAPDNAVAMLYDTTRCIGCKTCVVACSKANDLPPDTRSSGGLWQTPSDLNSQTKNIIKLFQDEAAGVASFVKKQCMHCVDPACVRGCPFAALIKDERGIVQWRPERCIGCRYCEVACPYRVPKFEWDRFNPRIVKCEFCRHLLGKTKDEPACCEVCPTGAVIYGTREELLADAKQRLAANPGKYYENRIYGEDDVGGLQVLYLSHVPFEKIGLPELGPTSIPDYAGRTHRFLTKFLVAPSLLWVFFTTLIRKNWKHHDEEARRIEAEEGLRDQL